MDVDRINQEVDRNYDFFQRNLASYLGAHRGDYALLRDCVVIDFYSKPGDAYREGIAKFVDGLFSIQEVTDEAIDLGLFSYVGH